MLFRQLFDAPSSTYTYLLADDRSHEAVLIDSVFEQFERDAALITELGLKLVYTLETHVHADHVTAAWLMRERFGSRIVLSKHGGAEGADVLVDDGDVVRFGAYVLEVRSTPGHTNGCVTYVLGEHRMAFTGDALLIRGAGRTDFQQGDARTLYRSVTTKILSLPDDTVLYPGHDYSGRTMTSVGEEKRFNPRLGGDRSEDDFVGYMNNLGLPHPKQIDVAVPANLECGKPNEARRAPLAADWAPVVLTFAGVPEVGAEWLHEQPPGSIRVLDVRTSDEFRGELGHIRGAELVPLEALEKVAQGMDKALPTVLVCRSGGRSAQGVVILKRLGFSRVANLAGGMIRWRGNGYAIDSEAAESV
jgi:glyoxylase-like metal-dependent hydrolase (beta-lactamase superfamily II)/rhodanese-related sulfurtransferase